MFAQIHQCLIILLISEYTCYAILVGNGGSDNLNANTQDRNITSKEGQTSSENRGLVQVSEDSPVNKSGEDVGLNVNTTFYYDPDEYLISNKRATNSSSATRSEQTNEKNSPPPASPASTSARNGRMLDLDALVGDFATSRANKERIQTGNRQSRYLSPSQPHALDVGGGKKLHIQGFIPIVGVKDVTEDEGNSAGSSGDGHELDQIKHRPQSAANDLPYAASSIGHASFGVQRYLNSEQQPVVMNIQQQQQQQQQVEAKFSGASVVESLKRPLKKLTGHSNYENPQVDNFYKQAQNCLCVPFYMCKNGYLSESSLSKNQIQQMIIQQQQQQQQQQHQQQAIEMKSGQLMMAPHAMKPSPQQVDSQVQYSDSYAPIDERSLDREAMSSVNANSSSFSEVAVQQVTAANQSDFTLDKNTQDQNSQSNLSPADELILSASNSSLSEPNNQQSSDYSQEILGRMLGLKSPSRSSSTGSSSTSTNGVCGLLRSCCNIPIHMFSTHEDSNNEMVQYGNNALASQQVNKYQPVPQQSMTNKVYSPMQPQPQPQLQHQALQKFQHQLQPSQTKSQPYGFSGNQISVMQPLNAPPFNSQSMSSNFADTTSLAHRSNQFGSQIPKYQQQQQPQALLAQYTRSAPVNQHLQSFQQASSYYPQHQHQAKAVQSVNLQAGQPMRQLQQQGLGTRKILEGRCGQRQSAGITGRVQNLQYHESSADFGEYPAQAAILKRLAGSENLFVCGGTLISQYWVATAAHCIKKHALGDLKVRLGEWDVHRDDEFYPFVEKEVKNIIIHPDFVAGNLVNDIALLRLDSPVDPSLSHVNPACLPNVDENFNHQRCWVTGWGKDSFGQKGSFQSVLQEVELPIIGQNECEQALRQTRLGPHYRLHPGFICAGGEGGRDACEGDGGSGLYCVQDGLIKVAGLVSWGIGCGQAGVPGVYVSLAQYRPWIENIISVDEDIYSPYANMIGNSLISERSNTIATNSSSKAN